MSSPRRPASAAGRTTRGPLPASVYWRRRVFVLGLAFALVFVIARWLGGSSDGSSDETPAAEQAGAQVSATQTVTAGETEPSTATSGATAATGATTPTLAAPEGTCQAADVVVTPSVPAPAAAGGPVALTLSLQTVSAEACTWQVSRNTVIVKIADGKDELWTTQQCPRAVPDQTVVVRRAVATVVKLTWNSRESAAKCSSKTNWVLPGTYAISAAALGGEPATTEFRLVKPAAKTVQVTPKARNTEKVDKPTKAVN